VLPAPEPISDEQYFGPISMVNLLRQSNSLLANATVDPPDDVIITSATAPLRSSQNPSRVSDAMKKDRHYWEQAVVFTDAFEENVLSVDPMLDEDDFHHGCEDIWVGQGLKVSHSFLALYYAVLGVGSLFTEQKLVVREGEERTRWARVMLREAQGVLDKLGTTTNIQVVQCLYLLVSHGTQHLLQS
jgi:hypothetical protein